MHLISLPLKSFLWQSQRLAWMSAFQVLHLWLCHVRRASLAAAKSKFIETFIQTACILEKDTFFFKNACFTHLISSSLYKAPWARVMVYGLGHKVRRNGQLNLMEAVCYPLDASPTNTGLTPPPTTNQYPSVIIPTDKVHVKLGIFLSEIN